ncbi:MAG: hypothetical protein ACREJB_09865 [Planctomycetaceae bacterium]
MKEQTLLEDFRSLSTEAQRQVVEFAALLKQQGRPGDSRNKRSVADLAAERFVGMWADRQDLQDSSAWVRGVREQH